MTKGRAWTAEEDRFLLENPLISAADASEVLPRSEAAIYDRRSKLRKAGVPVPSAGAAGNPNVIGTRTMLARTCPDCGLLLDAHWYRTYEPSGVYERTCKRCVRAKRAARPEENTVRQRRLQREAHLRYRRSTVDAAARNGQVWVEEDYAILANADMTLMEKALALKRTYTAVCQKASALGCSSKIGLGDPIKTQWRINNPNTIKETAS